MPEENNEPIAVPNWPHPTLNHKMVREITDLFRKVLDRKDTALDIYEMAGRIVERMCLGSGHPLFDMSQEDERYFVYGMSNIAAVAAAVHLHTQGLADPLRFAALQRMDGFDDYTEMLLILTMALFVPEVKPPDEGGEPLDLGVG